jgi:cytidylate kinase
VEILGPRGKGVAARKKGVRGSPFGGVRATRRRGVIAIDGPSGAGKSTVAKRLAEKLGYLYLDTGAMYRVVALKAKEAALDMRDEKGLGELCHSIDVEFGRNEKGLRVLCNGEDVTDRIRTPGMSLLASAVSRVRGVRQALAEVQRRFVRKGGVVLEGRDIGTVVAPDADIKFFIDADLRIRGARRYEELKARGEWVDLEKTIQEMAERDASDRTRSLAPLRKAEDAVVIDTSRIGVDEVVERMLRICLEKTGLAEQRKADK